MNNKVNFEQPLAEIIQFDHQDVIATSGKFGAYWAGDEEEELIY